MGLIGAYMSSMFLGLFMLALYTLIGVVSKQLFQQWAKLVFNPKPVANAAGTLLAVVWPLGWPLIIVVGLIHTVLIIEEAVIDSFRVLINHYRQSERAEQ